MGDGGRTISLAITGASGSAYGLRLLECLLQAGGEVGTLCGEDHADDAACIDDEGAWQGIGKRPVAGNRPQRQQAEPREDRNGRE